jgi:hypothetical protein
MLQFAVLMMLLYTHLTPLDHRINGNVGGCLSPITSCESQARGVALGLYVLPRLAEFRFDLL